MENNQRERILAIMQNMIFAPCSSCGHQNSVANKFCAECGSSMAEVQNMFFGLMDYFSEKNHLDLANLPDHTLALFGRMIQAELLKIQSGSNPASLPSPQQTTAGCSEEMTNTSKSQLAESPPRHHITRPLNPKEEAEELWERYHKEYPKVPKEVFMKVLNSPKCPMCGGPMVKMGAGGRGKAFGDGNLFGAFGKTYRCDHCGYLK